MTTKVNINGIIHGPEDAQISVFDRGFLYGDSVYEVIRTYEGRPFALGPHLDRLWRSGQRLLIPLPDRAWLQGELVRTIAATGLGECYCRVMVTRGQGPITLDPTRFHDPTCVILVKEYVPFPEEMYTQGIRVIIATIRRTSSSTLDPALKTGNYLNSILALGEARRRGFDDAFLLNDRGQVTEASSSNIFLVKGGALLTPALQTGLLEGVTRGLVLQLAEGMGLPCREGLVTSDDLFQAEEVMITSTLRQVMPVVEIEGHRVGEGRPGPLTLRLASHIHRSILEQVTSS